MYTVKKLQPNEIYRTIELSNNKRVVFRALSSCRWAVIDENGKVVFTRNICTQKWEEQIWPVKKVAVKQAEWLTNNQPETLEY